MSKKLHLTNEEMEGITEEDLEILRKAAQALATKSVNQTTSWKNPNTGTYGNITLLKIFDKNGRECRTGSFEIWKKGKTKIAKESSLCRNEDGTWDPVKSNEDK